MAKILLADDSTHAQRMGAKILTAEGHEVVTVSNGQAAVKKLSSFAPDLIVADVFMPGKNGYELCQIVKSDPQRSYIPVLLIVGQMEPYDPAEGKRVHADGLVTKPLESSDLVPLVQRLLASVQKPAPPAPQPAPPPPVEEPSAEEAAAEELFTASITSKAAAHVEFEMPAEIGEQPTSAYGDLLETPIAAETESELAVEPQVLVQRRLGAAEAPVPVARVGDHAGRAATPRRVPVAVHQEIAVRTLEQVRVVGPIGLEAELRERVEDEDPARRERATDRAEHALHDGEPRQVVDHVAAGEREVRLGGEPHRVEAPVEQVDAIAVAGAAPAREREHRLRAVDSDHACAVRRDPLRHEPRAAAEIQDRRSLARIAHQRPQRAMERARDLEVHILVVDAGEDLVGIAAHGRGGYRVAASPRNPPLVRLRHLLRAVRDRVRAGARAR